MSDTAAATTTTTPPAAESAAAKQSSTTAQPAGAKSETVVEKIARYIPGLGGKAAEDQSKLTPPAGPKRSRSSKKSKPSAGAVGSAEDPALATATLAEAPSREELPESLVAPGGGKERPAALNGDAGLTEDELAALQHKRFSPSVLIQKRLRANNKKLQRIQAYEDQTETLNADQKKAVASKPVLEAIQRELNDLIKVFEGEEADDDKRVAKKQQYEEKQVQLRINQAISNSKVHTQNDLTLLLQFLHLYSLFNPGQSFTPPTLPPVVANATGQQHAAVHTLFNSLANGPLFGGAAAGSESEDAVSQIQALQSGSEKSILEGVSFADIKQMILDLTAPPAEVGHEIPADIAEAEPSVSSTTAAAADADGQEPPLAAAETSEEPALNFMQASELAGGRQASADASVGGESVLNDTPAHQRALESVSAAATPGFGSGTPVLEKSQGETLTPEQSAPAASGWNEQQSQLTKDSLPANGGWEEDSSSKPITNWADEVDDHPSNPYTTTAEVPAELAGQNGPSGTDSVPLGGEAPGAVSADRGRGRGRGRGERGRGRGEFRGRGRGGFRGEGGDWRERSTDAGAPDSAVKAVLNAAGDGFTDVRGRGHRGGFRGGRGRGDGAPRGEFRGRGRGEGRGGRGGPRSGPNTPTTPAAAPAEA